MLVRVVEAALAATTDAARWHLADRRWESEAPKRARKQLVVMALRHGPQGLPC
jgi:hypothetical protein